MNYVTAKEAKKALHIKPTTLKVYKDQGKIKYKQLSSKKFLYDLDSVDPEFESERGKDIVIYARVSNTKQVDDLQKQIEVLKQFCFARGLKVNKIYKDIASGMNEERVGFNELIDEVIKHQVSQVYISFKDRLTRFGFKYFQTLFAKFGTEIVVMDELEETNQTFQHELIEDLISIIHHFSMKIYSNRRKKFKEIEKILNSQNEPVEECSQQINENKEQVEN